MPVDIHLEVFLAICAYLELLIDYQQAVAPAAEPAVVPAGPGECRADGRPRRVLAVQHRGHNSFGEVPGHVYAR